MIIRRELADKWLAAGSSPVDWCEENYVVSSHIAEFTNTVTNFPFIVLSAVALFSGLWRSYVRYATYGAYFYFVLLFIVSASSAYFHASLSFLGQMLDELAILWLLCFSYSFFTPNRYRPKFCKGGWSHFIAFSVATVLTFAGFVVPYINAYALFVVAGPIIYIKFTELFVYKNPATLAMNKTALVTALIAICLWVADRALCGIWRSLAIPGLHGIWHLLIYSSVYLDVCLFAYWRSSLDIPSTKTTIRYWPSASLGLPYVHCKGKDS